MIFEKLWKALHSFFVKQPLPFQTELQSPMTHISDNMKKMKTAKKASESLDVSRPFRYNMRLCSASPAAGFSPEQAPLRCAFSRARAAQEGLAGAGREKREKEE